MTTIRFRSTLSTEICLLVQSGVMVIFWRWAGIVVREVSDCNENYQSTSSRVSGSPSLPVLSMVRILRISILPVVRILRLSVVGRMRN